MFSVCQKLLLINLMLLIMQLYLFVYTQFLLIMYTKKYFYHTYKKNNFWYSFTQTPYIDNLSLL
jgi:hypothetical protein